jgi:FKBP-type peptidyl-prolyl cis-trans isomerase FklB
MRFKPYFFVAALLVSANAVAQVLPELNTDKQKASYALGLQVAQNLIRQGLDVDGAAFALAVRDALTGDSIRLDVETMRSAVAAYREKKVTENAAKLKTNRESGDKFRAEHRKQKDVTATSSGLQYKVLKAGTGRSPKATDAVLVHYRGALIDGTEFDSSHRRGKPAELKLDSVIKGWQEAVPLMKEGGKWQLVIPPELAYGERGAPGAIGPGATLVFEIELIAVPQQ